MYTNYLHLYTFSIHVGKDFHIKDENAYTWGIFTWSWNQIPYTWIAKVCEDHSNICAKGAQKPTV